MSPDSEHETDSEIERQLADLRADVATNRADIDSLQEQTQTAAERAEISEERADQDRQLAEDDRKRIHLLEEQSELDRQLIAELRAEGLVKDAHLAQLEVALGTARRIGAALGIIMASHKVGEAGAFTMLRHGSQNTNHKLRDLADDIVTTGDVSALTPHD